jgi:hypothetical protein
MTLEEEAEILKNLVDEVNNFLEAAALSKLINREGVEYKLSVTQKSIVNAGLRPDVFYPSLRVTVIKYL